MKTPIDLAYNCHYCHSTQGTHITATERMLGLGGKFTYTTCATCSSIQLITVSKALSYYFPKDILFDATAFQFWGTCLYERGEKLDPSKIDTHFSRKQLEEWKQQAIQYNLERKGDQACFFCVKPQKKGEDRA